MSTTKIVVLGALGAVVLAGFLLVTSVTGSYNTLVPMRELVDSNWGQVQTNYQRRYDLIPNLVSTVKGYATHERETLRLVTEARAKVSNVNVQLGKDGLTPQVFQQFQQAQGELSSALSRLMVVVEKYPDLKANSLFDKLMDEIAGTENRIAVSRRDYNESVQLYNQALKRFPVVLYAGMLGFSPKPYFAADTAAQNAPKVEF